MQESYWLFLLNQTYFIEFPCGYDKNKSLYELRVSDIGLRFLWVSIRRRVYEYLKNF